MKEEELRSQLSSMSFSVHYIIFLVKNQVRSASTIAKSHIEAIIHIPQIIRYMLWRTQRMTKVTP